MYHDLREIFLLEGLKRDIAEFVAKFLNCQKVKAKHQKSGGILQEIQIPTQKLEDLNMGIVVGLPRTQMSYDSICVVVDRFTKPAHFINVKCTYSAEDYARIFLDEIMFCNGIPLSII